METKHKPVSEKELSQWEPQGSINIAQTRRLIRSYRELRAAGQALRDTSLVVSPKEELTDPYCLAILRATKNWDALTGGGDDK
jgi:hypothetical protein